jgi:hypothetical protein
LRIFADEFGECVCTVFGELLKVRCIYGIGKTEKAEDELVFVRTKVVFELFPLLLNVEFSLKILRNA